MYGKGNKDTENSFGTNAEIIQHFKRQKNGILFKLDKRQTRSLRRIFQFRKWQKSFDYNN